eukprot:3602063-Alexandrium_andersonii.AAC.1
MRPPPQGPRQEHDRTRTLWRRLQCDGRRLRCPDRERRAKLGQERGLVQNVEQGNLRQADFANGGR